jgi:hypothetical protein
MSAAAAQISPGHLKTVADHPPAPTSDLVLEQRLSKERELAALEARIGEVAYQAAITGKAGAAALDDLHVRIRVARFSLDSNAAAHAHALEVDKGAIASWWQDVHALPPEEAISGLTKTECGRRCSESSGCVISGGLECVHPIKCGSNLNPRHAGNPAVRRLFKAAALKLGVHR